VSRPWRRRGPLALLTATALLALLAFAQASYDVDGVEVAFSTKGVFQVRYKGFTVSQGVFKTWGPGWQWVDACSWQDNWVSLKASAGDVDASFSGVFQCSFAQVSWSERAWVGVNAMLVELNLTAQKPSNFSGMAWDLDLPVALFAGKTVRMILMNGTEKRVKLREEHVPGTWVVEGSAFPNGFAWVAPYDSDAGVVLAVFGDAWPSGMSVHVEDNRQWGGNTYSLRNWLFFNFQLTPGVLVRLNALLVFYRSSSELEEALRLVGEVRDMVQRGEGIDVIRGHLLSAMKLEAAAEARKAKGPPVMLVVYAAAAAVAVALIAFIVLRRRK